MSTLCGKQNPSAHELCHRFILSPYTPRGNRMENYIENLDREPTVNDTRNIASLALEDLADYISVAFDKSFSLVRYAESIAVNETSFSQIEEKLNSPILTTFYTEVLEAEFSKTSITENENIDEIEIEDYLQKILSEYFSIIFNLSFNVSYTSIPTKL